MSSTSIVVTATASTAPGQATITVEVPGAGQGTVAALLGYFMLAIFITVAKTWIHPTQ